MNLWIREKRVNDLNFNEDNFTFFWNIFQSVCANKIFSKLTEEWPIIIGQLKSSNYPINHDNALYIRIYVVLSCYYYTTFATRWRWKTKAIQIQWTLNCIISIPLIQPYNNNNCLCLLWWPCNCRRGQNDIITRITLIVLCGCSRVFLFLSNMACVNIWGTKQ